MAHKQISEASNEACKRVNVAVAETLRRETNLDISKCEKSVEEEFEYLKSQVPSLQEFKSPIMLGTIVEGPIVLFGTLIMDKDYVNPLCDIHRLGSNFSKGIDVIFRHELAHERQDICWRKQDAREAAAEISAISRRGLKDLVDQLAVMLVVDICQPYSFLDPKNYGAEITKWIDSHLKYYAVDRWHDPAFIKTVSRFFKPARSIVKSIPTDYEHITKLVVQKATAIIKALDRSEETTELTKSSLRIFRPALQNIVQQ